MYKMTKDEMKEIQERSGLSVRAFCRAIEISNGDFYRIMYGKKRINERIEDNILMLEATLRKSLIKRIFSFVYRIFSKKGRK